jgi:hypothetical protein
LPHLTGGLLSIGIVSGRAVAAGADIRWSIRRCL